MVEARQYRINIYETCPYYALTIPKVTPEEIALSTNVTCARLAQTHCRLRAR